MKNNLIYTGKLTIKLGKRRRRLYNTGYLPLFELFANALLGKEISLPDHFKIVWEDCTEDEKITAYIQKRIKVNTITARYSGYLTTKIADNIDFVKIQLCKEVGDEDVIFAEIEVKDNNTLDILKNITTEKSALLEWDLSVGNKEGDN